MPVAIIEAFAYLKKASAIVNAELTDFSEDKANAISQACDEIIAGDLKDEFPLVVWQTGSGTQSNMNLNEVIANRATEILGGDFREEKLVSANDDVNKVKAPMTPSRPPCTWQLTRQSLRKHCQILSDYMILSGKNHLSSCLLQKLAEHI